MTSMALDDEQIRFLNDAIKKVKDQSFYMKRAIDEDNLNLVLDHAIEMLKELKSSALNPKIYYELYVRILDEMSVLEEYFIFSHRNDKTGKKIRKLYQQVQTCSNVIPRLYLLCCVGGVYILSLHVPAKDILHDLVDMVKGVQHPMRGLFLRNYLTLVSKTKLPDTGSIYEANGGGNVQDAYQFILQNFTETNRLWVRLQTQGANKEKKKREKERLDLRVLVGSNLVRLSQLDGLDIFHYKHQVLPTILEEIVTCRDTIAQSYLMDCIIQVFPDEFHMATLEAFLKVCTSLKEKVNVRVILEALMTRLSNQTVNAIESVNSSVTTIAIAAMTSSSSVGATTSSETLSQTNTASTISTATSTFQLFSDCIATLIAERSNMSLLESLKLQTLLINYALKSPPAQRMEYVSHCLSASGRLIEKSDYLMTSKTGQLAITSNIGSTAAVVNNTNEDCPTQTQLSSSSSSTAVNNSNTFSLNDSEARSTDETVLQIEALLAAPLSALSLQILQLPAYISILGFLPWGNWKAIGVSLLRSVIGLSSTSALSSQTAVVVVRLNDVESLKRLLNAITPLLKDKEKIKGSSSISPLEENEDNAISSSNANTTATSAVFKEEQMLVAKLVHLLRTTTATCSTTVTGTTAAVVDDDTDTQLRLYVLARKYFVAGGVRRTQYTIPPLVFASLGLVRRVLRREMAVVTASAVDKDETSANNSLSTPQSLSLPPSPPQYSSRKVFQFVLELINTMTSTYPDQALHLFLQAAQAADECRYHAIAYEFIKEALLLYECDITESKAQVRCLTAVIGTLLHCQYFSHEDYEALITKVTQYANKLLKKPDQCRMIAMCSHLFWPPSFASVKTTENVTKQTDGAADTTLSPLSTLSSVEQQQSSIVPSRYSNSDRVLECLQRALKIASVCDPNLFVEILDRYVYYYESGTPSIQARYVSGLIALIQEQHHISSNSSGGNNNDTLSTTPATVLAHYRNTIDYIKKKQQSSPPASPERVIQERFLVIEIN